MSFIIYNISWKTTDIDLKNKLKKYGDIIMFKYINCKYKRKPNICYIKYDKVNMNNLLSANIILNNREIKITRYYHTKCKWQNYIETNSKVLCSSNNLCNNKFTWQQAQFLNGI